MTPLERLAITAVRSNETFVPVARHPTPTRQPFAQQLTVDLYGCKHGAAAAMIACRAFLAELVRLIEMTGQSEPFTHRIDGGICGWVPLLEGCIQIHTVAAKNFVSLDIYCDRRFHSGKVLRLARATFEPKAFEMRRIPRGLKHCEVT